MDKWARYEQLDIIETADVKALYLMAYGFCKCAHLGQTRKYTGEPYANHPYRVASILSELFNDADVIVAAFLHDVLEDTKITAEELLTVFSRRVIDLVLEVTNVSTAEDGNRKDRKEIEKNHLAKSSPEGASIKLADIIDNVLSVAKNDKEFAPIYLREKWDVLMVLQHGHPYLWELARDHIACGFKILESTEMRTSC